MGGRINVFVGSPSAAVPDEDDRIYVLAKVLDRLWIGPLIKTEMNGYLNLYFFMPSDHHCRIFFSFSKIVIFTCAIPTVASAPTHHSTLQFTSWWHGSCEDDSVVIAAGWMPTLQNLFTCILFAYHLIFDINYCPSKVLVVVGIFKISWRGKSRNGKREEYQKDNISFVESLLILKSHHCLINHVPLIVTGYYQFIFNYTIKLCTLQELVSLRQAELQFNKNRK